MDESRYYQPSGAVPILGLFSALSISATAALIGGFLYGVAAAYNPFIYITFIGAAFVPGIVGHWLHTRLVAGKVRSKGATVVAALLIAGTVIYASWWGYICVLSEWSFLLVTPLDVVDVAGAISEKGVWSIKGATPTGWALYLIWLIEAGLMIGATLMTALETLPPFCEDCAEVTTEEISKHPIPVRAVENLRDELEAEQYESLLESVRSPADASSFMTVTVNRCPRCSESSFLVIEQVTVTPGDNGEPSTSISTVIPWIKAEPRIVAALQAEIAKGPLQPEAETMPELSPEAPSGFIEESANEDEKA